MNNRKYENDRQKTERKKKREELEEQYKDRWVECEQVFPPVDGIEEYLGELDADLEWCNDQQGAYKRFLNIESYKKFNIAINKNACY